jgi:hypothetical protein
VTMTPDPGSATVRGMTFPVVIENPAPQEPAGPDTFLEVDPVSAADRAATWSWPRRRPADA